MKQEVGSRYPHFCFGFGYGSGVVPQAGYNYESELPLVDVIFVVENTTEWHSKNMEMNPNHYRGKFSLKRICTVVRSRVFATRLSIWVSCYFPA